MAREIHWQRAGGKTYRVTALDHREGHDAGCWIAEAMWSNQELQAQSQQAVPLGLLTQLGVNAWPYPPQALAGDAACFLLGGLFGGVP